MHISPFIFVLFIALLGVLAVAAVLITMASKSKKDGAPTARRFSVLAGLSFWSALVGLVLLMAGYICLSLADLYLVVEFPRRNTDEVAMAAIGLSVAAAVPAGLSLLLAIAGFFGLRSNPSKYGMGLAALSAVAALFVLTAAFMPKSSLSARAARERDEPRSDPSQYRVFHAP